MICLFCGSKPRKPRKSLQSGLNTLSVPPGWVEEAPGVARWLSLSCKCFFEWAAKNELYLLPVAWEKVGKMGLGDLLTLHTDLHLWENCQGGKHSTETKGLDRMRKKASKKRCSQSNKRHQMWQGDLFPLLSKHTQSWICARQFGRQDIVNSSLNPRNSERAFGRQVLSLLQVGSRCTLGQAVGWVFYSFSKHYLGKM